ncbi:hypothetical protein HELRODRAFT_175060 [Helobdella robusta]|uniref:Cilia- and flagella-associated protein 43 n=1 Tax=Helobdella robusta TaxID=6412 RepID=T1F8S8_HELRO|nr:hypothetical protein HELRODRAFT_175060 [Helobdella robusta]ESO01035.1 hypothetical protein HELRODRAFT_175060 [Helobdella robusta]
MSLGYESSGDLEVTSILSDRDKGISPVGILNENILCIKCSNYLKFFGDDDKEVIYTSEGSGIGAFGVHKTSSVFAYSENTPHPKVFLVQYPDFNVLFEHQESEALEYLAIEFSNSSYLALITGLPEFELSIWRYTENKKVFSSKIPHNKLNTFAFNPSNMKQFAFCSNKEIIVWTLDQVNEDHYNKSIVYPPHIEGASKKNQPSENFTNLSNLMTNDFIKSYLNIPKSCVVGLSDEEFQTFEDELKNNEKMVPVCCNWFGDELWVGCQGNQIFKVDLGSYVPYSVTKDFGKFSYKMLTIPLQQ